MGLNHNIEFAHPWWLIAALLAVWLIWMGYRNLAALGPVRRWLALVLRGLVVLVLALALARPSLTEKSQDLTLLTVMDHSASVPAALRNQAMDHLDLALGGMDEHGRLALVDVAEQATIAQLPSNYNQIRERNTVLQGGQSKLAQGIGMAMAIAPPDTAMRMLLVSDGNETGGDLKEAARTAAANGIPIDVMPLRYNHDREVVFKRLAAPAHARSGQTANLRFILNSTTASKGKLMLTLNGAAVDLDPGSAEVAAAVELTPGANVKTASVPLGHGGVHEFRATFVPDGPEQDSLSQNNRASAMTFVSGPGHVLVVGEGQGVQVLLNALNESDITARGVQSSELPTDLAALVNTDAVVLVNTENSAFSYEQQEMLCRYVKDIGGGLVMLGGPDSFGAGGWIGSPVAEILPVDLDPPQKKQMPKGALALIMHACEIPDGNYWGKRIAIAAIRSLSSLDLAGVLDYSWSGGAANWVYPLSEVGDKKAAVAAIKQMQMGDMPDFAPHMQAAYTALKGVKAGQKHVIMISDGDPQMPSNALLNQYKAAKITVTGVGINPHSQNDLLSLTKIAKVTGGRFYHVKSAQQLPRIFVKEAQVIRRSMIVEKNFVPKITYGLSETVKGLAALPALDGYVLTGPKGGLNQIVMATPDDDPILATCQAGLGRCVAFTSSADSRWAGSWVNWAGGNNFWEQLVRWAGKSADPGDCDVYADVEGRRVTVTVEAVDTDGESVQLSELNAQAIGPNLSVTPLALRQVGPGQYRAEFEADGAGNYVVNLRYRKQGDEAETIHTTQGAVTVPFAPEYQDLSDNEALLREVAEITGGRVLEVDGDPETADLFTPEGVTFPVARLSLVQPLLLSWLVLFILDVAVRRVAVDLRALVRKLRAALAKARTAAKEKATIDQLKTSRQKAQEKMATRVKRTQAARRYTPTDTGATDDTADPFEGPVEPKPQEKAAEAEDVAPPTDAEGADHISRLLKARRKRDKDE